MTAHRSDHADMAGWPFANGGLAVCLTLSNRLASAE
jgi:hypothetical protein